MEPREHRGEMVADEVASLPNIGPDDTKALADIEDSSDFVSRPASGHEEAPAITFGFLAASLGEVQAGAGSGAAKLIGEKRIAGRESVEDLASEVYEFKSARVDTCASKEHGVSPFESLRRGAQPKRGAPPQGREEGMPVLCTDPQNQLSVSRFRCRFSGLNLFPNPSRNQILRGSIRALGP